VDVRGYAPSTLPVSFSRYSPGELLPGDGSAANTSPLVVPGDRGLESIAADFFPLSDHKVHDAVKVSI